MAQPTEKQMFCRQIMSPHQRHPGNYIEHVLRTAIECGEIRDINYHEAIMVWQLVEGSAHLTELQRNRLMKIRQEEEAK